MNRKSNQEELDQASEWLSSLALRFTQGQKALLITVKALENKAPKNHILELPGNVKTKGITSSGRVDVLLSPCISTANCGASPYLQFHIHQFNQPGQQRL